VSYLPEFGYDLKKFRVGEAIPSISIISGKIRIEICRNFNKNMKKQGDLHEKIKAQNSSQESMQLTEFICPARS